MRSRATRQNRYAYVSKKKIVELIMICIVFQAIWFCNTVRKLRIYCHRVKLVVVQVFCL